MDWLKLLSYIISSIAIALSLNARLKRFNNERISAYKDMKEVSSELKMEIHEIKSIDDELKNNTSRGYRNILSYSRTKVNKNP